jgi:peptidoglycan/xylan/chitin deacetylase (PgdA/CDA1 family)
MKHLARATLTSPWVMSRAEAASGGHPAIFLLHRFSDLEHGPDGFPALALRRHLEWLRGRRYNLAPIGDLVAALREGRPTPPKSVAFTVDDGYDDFARVAAPIFAEFDCPVTVFLVTDFLDGPSWLWWDRIRYMFATSSHRECTVELGGQPFTVAWDTPLRRGHAAARLIEAIKWYPARQRDAIIQEAADRLQVELPARPRAADAPMSWDTVRRLAASGVSFGPHSCCHPIHSAEDAETSRREIASSWQRVREEVPDALPIYCYPNGDDRSFGAREVAFLPELGLQAGISARPDYLSIGARPALPDALGRIPRFSFDADPARFMQVASGIERLKLRWRP